MEHQTTRINASMMASFHGKNVCLLGMAKEVDSNGTSFTLTTSDGKDVKVAMQEPLNEYVNGLTEVQGIVGGNNSLKCQNYITFAQDVSETFNMDMYNTALELTARAPQYYQQGIQNS